MFSQPPEEKLQESINTVKNSRKKRKRKLNQKQKQLQVRNHFIKSKLSSTMSSWAESFTFAATWQLKHQVAYWKARAKALEYENKLLHDVIKGNYTVSRPTTEEQSDSDCEESNLCEEEEEEFEASEELVQFLRNNAKYREDARLERERFKSTYLEDNTIAQLEAGPSEPKQDPCERSRELYGDKWERITALEVSLETLFMNENGKEPSMYWPNIPFNFNFS